MIKKPTGKNVDIHLFVPIEDYERWLAHKDEKYNGLPAMSKMIRDFVNEGIARENEELKE